VCRDLAETEDAATWLLMARDRNNSDSLPLTHEYLSVKCFYERNVSRQVCARCGQASIRARRHKRFV